MQHELDRARSKSTHNCQMDHTLCTGAGMCPPPAIGVDRRSGRQKKSAGISPGAHELNAEPLFPSRSLPFGRHHGSQSGHSHKGQTAEALLLASLPSKVLIPDAVTVSKNELPVGLNMSTPIGFTDPALIKLGM